MVTINETYTLNDFERVTFDGFDLNLPEETIDLIASISDKVGAPSYIRTPNFQKREKYNGNKDFHNKRRRNRPQEIHDDDWEAIRNFQATELKKREGIEKHIDLIRTHLNKITDKNYAMQLNKIITEIDGLISVETDEESMLKVGYLIFTTASTNKFYSELYATLYKDLMDKFDIIKDIFDKNFKTFMDLFKIIEYVDPEENYEEFCKVNKQNDERRAMSMFIVNLMKNEIISHDAIINTTLQLQDMTTEFVKIKEKRKHVEELTENIFIIVTCACEILYKHDDWETVLVNINRVSEMKTKTYPGVSSKTIFKYMDIIDAINEKIK